MESSLRKTLSCVAPVLAQLGVALAGLVCIAFAPPAQGRILLVPLTTNARALLPVAALGHDALLLGSGPFPGSLVVMAERERFAWRMLRIGVLPVAASPAGCGPFTQAASGA